MRKTSLSYLFASAAIKTHHGKKTEEKKKKEKKRQEKKTKGADHPRGKRHYQCLGLYGW